MKHFLYSSLFVLTVAVSTPTHDHKSHGMAQVNAENTLAIASVGDARLCPTEQCTDRNYYVDHRDCTCKIIPHACDFN